MTVWAVSFSTAGYLFGQAIETLLADGRRYTPWLFGGLVAFAGVFVAARALRRWRHSHAP